MTQRSQESITLDGLVAAWKATAVEATVPPTAGELIAQWVKEAEAERDSLLEEWRLLDYKLKQINLLERRLRSTLDAIQQARRE